MEIMLKDILHYEMKNYKVKDYKVDFASRVMGEEGPVEPLDVFVRNDKEEREVWYRWRGPKHDYNLPYVFTLIKFYPESDIWLFGGVYEVTGHSDKPNTLSYEVELTDQFEQFVGRLKIRCKGGRPRNRVLYLEGMIDKLVVSSLLKERYTGEAFCGYEDINHDFGTLESIFKTGKPDWKAALEHVKGVYLIMDKSNGRKYVGSAYGDAGIWSRWSSYMGTGHGGNKELVKLIKEKGEKGMDYARQNFQFSLLEYRSMKTDDKDVIARENYWKEALLSRDPRWGYNKK